MLNWEAIPELEGELHSYPFLEPAGEHLIDQYSGLLDEHDHRAVLVLSRFPSGVDLVNERIRKASDFVRQPRVESLAGHARKTLRRLNDGPTVLSETERTALLRAAIRSKSWSAAGTSTYLEKAADREGFVDDVQRFVTEASWQARTVTSADPSLDALGGFLSEYHELLDDLGRIDAQNVVQYLVRCFQADTAPDGVDDQSEMPSFDSDPRTEIDAILVLDFEEFTPIDRAYLSYLSRDSELLCLSTRDSSIQRVWNEAGCIEDIEHGLSVETHDRRGYAGSDIAAVAHYLATGETVKRIRDQPPEELSGLFHVSGSTFADQLSAVASEIEQKRELGHGYDDIGIVLRDAKAPIEDVVDRLWELGVPADSTTVTGMEHDPTARELYHVASLLAGLPSGVDLLSEIDRDQITLDAVLHASRRTDGRHRPSLALDRSGLDYWLSRLLARVDLDGPEALVQPDETTDGHGALDLSEVCALLTEMAGMERLDEALQAWLNRTQLVHRVAREEDRLAARHQFENLAQVLQLAEFHEDNEHLHSTWSAFRSAFEEQMERTRTDRVPTEATSTSGAVTVDATRNFKNDERKFVFVLGLVEGEFPARPEFNRLFSPQRLNELPEYPALTDPDTDDFEATFGTEFEGHRSNGPGVQRAYYYALHRRFLAVAAGMAKKELYLCSYERQEGILGESKQRSRFLRELDEIVGPLDGTDRTAVRTSGDAESYVRTRFDRSLETARRAVATGDPVPLDAITEELRIAGWFLQQIDDPVVEEGIRTQIAHATGEVMRRE